MTSVSLTREDRDRLAAEHALGLLEGEELALAIRLQREDQDFRQQVACWLGQLAPLLDRVEPVEPPSGAFAKILARTASAGQASLSPMRSLRLWQGLAGGASALAASLALILVTRVPPEPIAPPAAAPPMIAMLESDQGSDKLVATWSTANRNLTIMPAAGMAPAAGHSHQLWMIGADGKPKSMGMLHGRQPVSMTVPADDAGKLADGVTLAVSVEPEGGSPTGLPTGPVIASGPLRTI
jgi:anti-sigma-K factor RskA